VATDHGNYSSQCHGLIYDAQINRVNILYTVYNWDYTEVGKGRGVEVTTPIYEKISAEGKPLVTSYRIYSDDEGQTWSQPVDISDQVGRQAHFGSSEGRQVSSGKYQGRLLVAGSRMDLDASGAVVAKHPGVWRSDDHGATWTLSVIPEGPVAKTASRVSSEARVTELADGLLLYNQRTKNKGRQLSWSRDGGVTWSESRHAAELKATQCNGSTMTLRNAAGRLTDTVLFSVPSPGGRSDGLVYVSEDGGQTWGEGKDVVKGYFAYSALIQIDAQTVGLFYEANHYKDIRFVTLSVDWLRDEAGEGSEE
jgi:sialidase-1